MLEFIGLIVVVIIVYVIFDAWSSDNVDFTIMVKGKNIWEYHKNINEENDKNNEKDLK